MAMSLAVLTDEALQLSTTERALLAEHLLASLGPDPAVEAVWEAEVARRIAEVEAGSVTMLPGPETLARLRAAYR